MVNPNTAEHPESCATPNSRRRVEITRADLPLHCPQDGECLWNAHPRVFLDIEDTPGQRVICPYCSTEYILVD